MTAPRRHLGDEALPGGTPDWADFDGDLREAREDRGAELRSDGDLDAECLRIDSHGDLDRDATLPDDRFPNAPAFRHRRRAHMFSAAGAGLAVALALAIHAATDGPAYRSAPARPAPFARLSRTVKPHRPARRMKFPAHADARHRRVSSTGRVPHARLTVHATPVVHTVVASSRGAFGPAGSTAEFGFER